MGTRRSDTIDEEMALIQRELDDDDIQAKKKEELGEEYQKYIDGLKDRYTRLSVEYESEISKGN